MISLTIIAFGILLLTGGAAFLRAVHHAPVGYEDEHDFHEHIHSQPPGTLKTAVEAQLRTCASPAHGSSKHHAKP